MAKSLVGSLCKLLANVLANRLKNIVGKVVSSSQNAIVQILDAALIANEAMGSMLRRKERALLCKLNIKKVYDHVDWDFLLRVLDKMSFGERLISRIQ